MRRLFSLAHSMELIAALLAVAALAGVVQTFVIGRHFIIPTGILLVAIVLINLARYGLKGQAWAKQILFWMGFLMTCHAFFALFWARWYRAVLGSAFEFVFGGLVLVLAFLVFQYARKNALFGR